MDTTFKVMEMNSMKRLVLAASIGLAGSAALFAQAPQSPEKHKKVICIVESDTMIVGEGLPGHPKVWVSEDEVVDGKKQVHKVVVITDDENGAYEFRTFGEDMMDAGAESGEGGEQKVVVMKHVVAPADANGKAQVHVIKIVNGDTVMNEVHGEEMHHKMMMEGHEDFDHFDHKVDVQVKDDGHHKHVIVVRMREVKISDLEGEEASKFAPKKGEELSLKEFEYFPNPNQGQFTLRLRLPEKQSPARISISTLEGKEIFQDKTDGSETRYEKEIDLGDAAAGVYLLTVSQGNQKAVKRIVVE